MAAVKQALEDRRQEAQVSHKYYTEVTSQCRKEWEQITELMGKSSLSDEEKVLLDSLKKSFKVVIAAGY